MNTKTMNAKIALVVDDDKDMREMVREYLTMSGYEVIVAWSRTEAIAVMMNTPDIELVITDNDMPQKDEGLEVIRQARMALPKTTRVWLMSGRMSPTMAHTVVALGANRALGKATELIPALIELVNTKQLAFM